MNSSKLKIFFSFGLILLLSFSFVISKDKKDKDKIIIESETIIGATTGKFNIKKLKNKQRNPELVGRRPVEKIIEKNIKCPSCRNEVPVLYVKSARVALDTDLCQHFVGLSQYSFEFWSCSACGYTQHLKFFEDEVQKSLKTLIKKSLRPQMHAEIKSRFGSLFKKLKTKPLNQKIIPTYVKILNMSTYLENQTNIEDKWKVFVYMRGIYALRNEISQAPGSTKLNPVFLKISKLLKKNNDIPETQSAQPHFPTYSLFYYEKELLPQYKQISQESIAVRILIAQAYNRLGYNSRSKAHLLNALKQANAIRGLSGTLKHINRMIKLIDLETSLMKKTRDLMILNFEKSEKVSSDASYLVYLIGEFSRRIDDYKSSYHWLKGAYQLFPSGDKEKGIKKSHMSKWIDSFFNRKEYKPFTQSDTLIRHPKVVIKTVRKIKQQQVALKQQSK